MKTDLEQFGNRTDWSGNPPIVIGISGASCSGKSWLADTIRCQIGDHSEVLDLDGYYRNPHDVECLEHGHDNPLSIDFDRATNDLRHLKTGKNVHIPVYSFEIHQVTGTRPCAPKPLILVEGLFVFADSRLRDQMDLKIWIEASEDLRLNRRISRDISQRERTINEIQQRYARDVIPGYQKFIHPLRDHADVIVSNDEQDPHAIPRIVNLVRGYVQRPSQL